MSEYPEDIMKTAGALAAWVYWGEHDEKEHAEAIADAILAERNRCAGLARKWGETCRSIGQVVEADIAEDIAVTIEDSKQ